MNIHNSCLLNYFVKQYNDDSMLTMILAALLEKIRKVEKYIDSLMLEDREMKGGNGSIYLKVSQL